MKRTARGAAHGAAMVALWMCVVALGFAGVFGVAGVGPTPAGAQEAHTSPEAEAGVDGTGAVIGPIVEQQFTFTEASGILPFTIENLLDDPVDVIVAFESPKLELPRGDEQRLTLPPGSTNLEVAVESLATGSFPLEIKVLSADGTTELASTRFTVRSTAISGIGLVLSVSAGLFLLMWWAKHFHGVRRDRRLVSRDDHPAQHQHTHGVSDEPA